MDKCKVCGRSDIKIDEDGLCWVCAIKQIDKNMDELEGRDKPVHLPFDEF